MYLLSVYTCRTHVIHEILHTTYDVLDSEGARLQQYDACISRDIGMQGSTLIFFPTWE